MNKYKLHNYYDKYNYTYNIMKHIKHYLERGVQRHIILELIGDWEKIVDEEILTDPKPYDAEV